MCSSFTAEADGVPEVGAPSKTVLNSPSPVAKYCYYCRRVVWTKIKYYPTLKTRMMAFGLSPCLLCWVPYFCHWKAELDHHCSFCDGYLGTYNPFFENKVLEALTSVIPNGRPDEKKQPQKKYREVGRRCGEYSEPFTERDKIIRVYSDILQFGLWFGVIRSCWLHPHFCRSSVECLSKPYLATTGVCDLECVRPFESIRRSNFSAVGGLASSTENTNRPACRELTNCS